MYTFQVTTGMLFDAHQALSWVKALLAMGAVGLQIVARPAGIEWRVAVLEGAGELLATLRHPQTHIQRSEVTLRAVYPCYRASITYTTRNSAFVPLVYITDLHASHDPLLGLAHTLSYLQEGEEIRYTVLVSGRHKPLWHRAVNAVDTVTDLWRDPARYPRAYELILEHKSNHPWYQCVVNVEIDSPDPHRVRSFRQTLDLHLNSAFDRTQANHPFNGLRSQSYSQISPIRERRQDVGTQVLFQYAHRTDHAELSAWFDRHWLYLEAAEIAALWHLPHAAFATCNIVWAVKRPALNYDLATHDSGVILGQAYYQEQLVPIYQHPDDMITHTNIIGKTGSGKSTQMKNIVHQMIADGCAVILIDAHGSQVQSLLRHSIPLKREAEVVVLDFAETDHPIPLNVFAGSQSYAGIGRVVDAIERFHTISGVRMDRYLQAGILALQTVPNATMKDLYYLLVDHDFRHQLLQKIEDEEVYQTLYEEYHLLTPQKQREIRAPIINRISPFFVNPYLYPSLCHPSRLDFADLMDQGRIILISLGVNSEWVPHSQRNLVGALIISLVQMIGMNIRRTHQPVYVYIDEVQNFVTSSLDTVLSEARKYQLYTTIAHQFLDQLPPQTLKAVMGTVGTTIAFGLSPEDARAIGAHMSPQFRVEDLVGLDRFQAAVKMQHRGETQPAFLLQTDPPPPDTPAALAREKRIRQLSVARYLPLTRREVLARLAEQYPSLRRRTAPPAEDLNYDQFVEG